MYCASCGSGISPTTIYCNRCGAKVPSELSSSTDLFPTSLVWAIIGGFVAGIGVIIGLMAVMKEVVGFDHGQIMGIAYLSFFVLFIIEGVLLSLLIGSRRRKAPSEPAQLPSRSTRELEEARQPMINQPIGSVTEGTTRTFEPVYSERKSD